VASCDGTSFLPLFEFIIAFVFVLCSYDMANKLLSLSLTLSLSQSAAKRITNCQATDSAESMHPVVIIDADFRKFLRDLKTFTGLDGL